MLFTVVVKQEWIMNVITSTSLKIEVDPRALIVLVKKGFDTKDYRNKGFRSAYRKYFKSRFVENGVPIIEVDDIEEIIFHKSDTRFKTLKKRREYLDNLTTEWKDEMKNKAIEGLNSIPDIIETVSDIETLF